LLEHKVYNKGFAAEQANVKAFNRRTSP